MKKIFFTTSVFLITFCHMLQAGRRDAIASYNKSKSGINDTVLYVLCGIGIALIGATIYFIVTKKK